MKAKPLTCPQCGSADVAEVRTDTYFCNHHDGVFKVHDPTRLTVHQVQAFCRCGNPVTAQCSICHTASFCAQCDAVTAAMEDRRLWSFKRICFATQGFGYRPADSAAPWMPIVEGRMMKPGVDSRPMR